MITIGPFIIPSTHPDTPDGCFRHTGFSMELVCDGLLFELPIYKNASHLNGQFASFDDFYFPEPEDGWPVDFVFKGIHDKPTRYGRFVAISPLLVEIFNQLRPGMPMEDFLRDFRTAIPIFKNSRSEWREPQHGEINLTENLENLGFVVSSVYLHGVTLNVDVAWSFQDDHSGWKNISAGFIEFRPRCGKLNDGKWIGQRWKECIESHYFARLAAVAPKKPIDSLRSAGDIENLLNHYEWTNTTRHSEAEIRQMRIEAIQKNPELGATPKKLAEHLRREDLYSRNTSTSQIVKFLPGLFESIPATPQS